MVVHCMTGLARGPLVASLLAAVAHNEDLQVAIARVERLRNTHLVSRAWELMGGMWAAQAIRMDLAMPRYPAGFAVAPTNAMLGHAVVMDEEGCYLPLCKWRRGELAAYVREPAFAETIAGIMPYCHEFCRDCRPLLIASQQIESYVSEVRARGLPHVESASKW